MSDSPRKQEAEKLETVDVRDEGETSENIRALVAADLLDERYSVTQRRLKNRHVQLMALGGTIGTGMCRGKYDVTD